jgi:phenylacetate-CoA ligase
MRAFWNEKIETLPREELADLQLERLQVTLNRGYTKVDFYRQRFEDLGFLPEDIKSMEDLARLPCTTDSDLVEHAFTFNHAAELIGATVAPTSIASATIQVQIMQDFRSTVLATSPTFAMHIAETRERLGIDLDQTFLRIGLFGPEAMSSDVRRRLEERLRIQAYTVYGVNEMVEPGMASECQEKSGLHLAEDHFYPEIVDPDSCQPLAHGQEGELVVTTLTNEGYPFIRFRTGDITTLDSSPCPCGRTGVRMAPPLSRSDDLFMVRGISIHPEQVKRLLGEAAPEVESYRIIVRKRDGLNDQLELQVAYPENYVSEWYHTHALADDIRARLRRALGLGIKVKLMEASNLAEDAGRVVFEE